MAETSYPFATSSINTELEWSRMARRWQIDGVASDDPASSTLKVVANGTNTVTVDAGTAFVNGFFYRNDALMNVSVPANGAGTPRIDRVVLRVSQTANSVTVVYVTGGTSAPALATDETDVYEMALAQVTIAPGSSVAQAANVVDQRFFVGKPVAIGNASYRRPPTKGQLLVEGSTLLVGTGAAWLQVYPTPVSTFVGIPLSSGWTNYGAPWAGGGYTKTGDGLVVLQGLIKTTVAKSSGSNIVATLPAGFRPGSSLMFTCQSQSSAGVATRVDVNPNGQIVANIAFAVGEWLSLSPISFVAAG